MLTKDLIECNRDYIIKYFRSGEKERKDFRLGMELEHFVLHKDTYRAVSYYEKEGIEDILKELISLSWEGIYEGENLIGLKGKNANITLEPGGQLELSVFPELTVTGIELTYQDFLNDIKPILKDRDMCLLAMGYQPVSQIKDIPLLPKERYQYMYQYFKQTGKYAHNMMKGTASLQLNLDYRNEKDFIKKMSVAYYLSPLVYTIFNNSPVFEGSIYNRKGSIRSLIWDNCDFKRCNLDRLIFADDFAYDSYADFILNMPPIIIKRNDCLLYTANKITNEIYSDYQLHRDEVEHLLSMVFPDVRAKKFIELRAADALPYPYNLAYIVFWKGLLYNKRNLELLYNEFKTINYDDFLDIKEKIRNHGLNVEIYGETLLNKFTGLLELVVNGLGIEEREYLFPLYKLLERKVTIKELLFKDGLDSKLDLSNCIL
ncbi:MAG: glutamate--cysteine ligase [Firmicutes bacterium]|nr:glutamate--cysteine ligase [Bacillota bacterium]